MLMGAASDEEGEESETVLTFAGNGGSVFHKTVQMPDGELRPRCGTRGRGLVEKMRALIESHYDACEYCYHDAESNVGR